MLLCLVQGPTHVLLGMCPLLRSRRYNSNLSWLGHLLLAHAPSACWDGHGGWGGGVLSCEWRKFSVLPHLAADAES